MAVIYATLFWCALQVTLFLTLAAPIYLLVRRRNPHAATFAAASSLAAVILLSALAASPWPRWSLTAGDGGRVALADGNLATTDVGGDQAKASATNSGVALGADEAANPASPLASLWEAVRFAATPAPSTMNAEAPAEDRGLHWSAYIVALFIAGMAVSGVHLAAGLVAVRRLIAGSRPLEDASLSAELASLGQRLNIVRPVSLHESTEIATPATIGWRRPAILLPPAWRTWSDVERRSVLAHELAHIAQHDFAAWLIARGAIVVHFYHPLVRWFASRLQLDQELAADAAAVRLLGDRQQYLHALANLALATPMHRIAGPARTFIPGRSLLVRRVEMLRTNADIRPTTQLSSTLRWAIAPALATLAIIAGGLRPPAPSVRAAEPETATVEKPAVASASSYDFSYVPNDFIFLFAIRPSEIAASSQLRPLADFINEASRPQLRAESMEQLTFVLPPIQRDEHGAIIPGTGSEYTVFRTNGAVNFKPLLEASYGPTKAEDYNGKQLVTWGDSPTRGRIEFYSPVAGTLVSTPHAGLVRVIDNPESVGSPTGAMQWLAEANGPMFGVVDFPALKSTVGSGLPQLLMFQPIVESAEYATISIEDGDPLALKVSFACRNHDDAVRVERTLQAAVVVIKNIVTIQSEQLSTASTGPKPTPQSDMRPLLELADRLLASAKVEVSASRVDLTASLQDPAETIRRALVAPLWAGRQAATRTISMNNLKQLGLAANRYEAMARSFPPAVFYGKSSYGDLNKSGDNVNDVPRSWRVELLPLLGQEELYKQYRLDQPWDSEVNMAVLRKAPDVFRSPNDEPTSINASYFALTGPSTVFDGNEGTELKDIKDGISSTLLFAEAKRDVPWTKPEDLPYDPAQPVPTLGGWRPDEFLIVLCDGSVLPVANGEGVDKNFLNPWIEKSDGQVPPRLFPAAPAP